MKNQEYTCTVTYTEGYEKRVTEAFVDLYYKRLEGLVVIQNEEKRQEATA